MQVNAEALVEIQFCCAAVEGRKHNPGYKKNDDAKKCRRQEKPLRHRRWFFGGTALWPRPTGFGIMAIAHFANLHLLPPDTPPGPSHGTMFALLPAHIQRVAEVPAPGRLPCGSAASGADKR